MPPASKVRLVGSDSRWRRFVRLLCRVGWRWSVRGFAVFGALVALFWATLDLSVVVSPSMAPTLQGTAVGNGDRVLTEKVTYRFRMPRRWEVIAYTTDTGEKRMKRIVGLPGESVQMPANGVLLIDGRRQEIPGHLNNPYLRFGNLMDGNPVPCGDGFYVLGDDVKDSDDSRFNPPTPARQVVGRVWLIVAPWRRVGFVR